MENQEDLKGASPGHRLDRPRHRVENVVPLSRQLRRITSSIKSTFARTGGLAGEQNVGGGMGGSKSGWIGYLTLIDPVVLTQIVKLFGPIAQSGVIVFHG